MEHYTGFWLKKKLKKLYIWVFYVADLEYKMSWDRSIKHEKRYLGNH